MRHQGLPEQYGFSPGDDTHSEKFSKIAPIQNSFNLTMRCDAMRKELQRSFRIQTSLMRNQDGMTYLFVMMLVVFMTISLLGMTQQWSVIMKRDREAELLFRGNRIKDAIDRYVADYEVQKATRPNQWPRTLVELTKKSPKRYLQVAYSDPITGKKFELIKVGEELHGVRSSSTDIPYNRVDFKGAKTYQAIRFESTGANANCQLNPLNPTLPTNCAPPGTTLPPGTIPASGTTPNPGGSPPTASPAPAEGPNL